NLAVIQAQMNTVINNLTHGLNTNLGENGVRLSGGQRQRIALARAFYFNRRILVMDEATSSLDANTEAQIINYLKNLKNKITVISITHRATSLAHCDRVLNIEHGQIINTQNS
ncbi:ATP-binding cassette domain-containing protein, partial [Alphaproteobacteria bacterium]|nr:ATP-binding cassette domain-containing protein [Alphaproteobacteria bacterium]